MNRKRRLLRASFSIKLAACTLFLFSLLACDSDQPSAVTEQEKSTKQQKSSNKDSKSVKLSKAGLTDENAEAFLLEYGNQHKEDRVVIHTDYGDIELRLFRNTPVHRANFIYLAHQKYFDDTWIYRVNPEHVIQAGNNDDPETGKKRTRIGNYKLPNEIGRGHFHTRGSLAAARTYYQNPERRSNPYEFYIVLGKSYTERALQLLSEAEGFELTEAQRKVYASNPGSPHLDKEHTVFGEVIKGMDVVKAISEAEADSREWPIENIPIRVELVGIGNS